MRTIFILSLFAAAAWAGAPYNTDDGLALKGYDPTTYFPESGLSPSRGVDRFELTQAVATHVISGSSGGSGSVPGCARR